MMAEQGEAATWQSCKVIMLHDINNADHQQSCHKIEKQQTSFIGYSQVSSLAPSERLVLKMALEFEAFIPQPNPEVQFFGAAASVRGRPLANIIEFTASRNFYLVVIELPQVQLSNAEIEWVVYRNGEVTIEGQISPAALFANMPIGRKTKRIKLCPTEPWGMSFYFPGPVDWLTSHVLFTSKTVMEVSVMKETPLPALPIVPNPNM